jgi:hypothetical protein
MRLILPTTFTGRISRSQRDTFEMRSQRHVGLRRDAIVKIARSKLKLKLLNKS